MQSSSKRTLSPEPDEPCKRKNKALCRGFIAQVTPNLLVEIAEDKKDSLGNIEYKMFKIRDVALNQLLVIYQQVSQSPVYFASKRHLDAYLKERTLRSMKTIDDQDVVGKNFRDWVESIGERHKWNSKFVEVNVESVDKLKESDLGKNLALGLSYLFEQ